MALKYQKEIRNFDCDLLPFTERNRNAFRWVFPDISEKRNFLPVYKISNRPKVSCKGYALSFFATQDQAKSKLLRLSQAKPKIFRKLGTHIAEGILAETDGISNNTNGEGHFAHFEYNNIELNRKFNIVEQVGAIA